MTDFKLSSGALADPLTGTELLEVTQTIAGEATTVVATSQEIADLGIAVGLAAVVTSTGTTYTAAASDVGKFRRFTNTSAKSATFEPEATTALPANGEWYFYNQGANNLTLIAGSGVTMNAPAGGSLVVPSGGTVAVKRLAADLFAVFGNTAP